MNTSRYTKDHITAIARLTRVFSLFSSLCTDWQSTEVEMRIDGSTHASILWLKFFLRNLAVWSSKKKKNPICKWTGLDYVNLVSTSKKLPFLTKFGQHSQKMLGYMVEFSYLGIRTVHSKVMNKQVIQSQTRKLYSLDLSYRMNKSNNHHTNS